MGSKKRIFAAAMVASSIAACSLTTDLSGFVTGDDPDAAVRDGSTGEDGGADATLPDASPGSDSGVVPCASRSPKPFFCTDFDDATPIVDLFDGKFSTELGDGVRDPLARSGASSLLLRQTKAFPSNCGYLEYWRDVGGPNAVVLETWVRLGDSSGAYPNDGVFASIAHRGPGGAGECSQIFRTLGSGGARLQSQRTVNGGGTSDDNYDFTRPLVAGVWTLLRVDLTRGPDGNGTRVRVTLDGETALNAALGACQLGTASVRVGMYCEARTTREMRFDNLVIDAR